MISDDDTFNGGINDTLMDDLHPAIEVRKLRLFNVVTII